MKVLTPLLFPFSVLYDAVTTIRNRLFDLGIRPCAIFEVPVIGVGNLSVGGTGKTPMIEFLIRLLATDYSVATLSRGYGRNTKGIRIVGNGDDASSVGDEPFQLYKKYGAKVVVAVGEERAMAIPYMLHQHPEINLILLDDAFQHRSVKPSFQILLTDYNHLFVDDFLLPAGRLRESRSGARRADVIVVTKCPPNVTDDEMMSIESSIRKYTSTAVFFSKISYGNILPVNEGSPYKPDKVILVTGIANPNPLAGYLTQNYNLIKHFSFADHHEFTAKDMEHICAAAKKEEAVVVTTEKDLVKMDVQKFNAASVTLAYLPIEIQFIKNGKDFDEMVLNVPGKHVE
jgi:tetraacyldisaccharide 4'-kinase